jgi:hypothetical protein
MVRSPLAVCSCLLHIDTCAYASMPLADISRAPVWIGCVCVVVTCHLDPGYDSHIHACPDQTWEFSEGMHIKGIYPREFLEVTTCDADPDADFANHFMNLKFHLLQNPDSPNSQRIETSVYDKRDFELKMLPPKNYVHIDSDAPRWCKENILYTQFLAQIELCSLANFDSCSTECARIYHRMIVAGHKPEDLWPLIQKAAKKAARKFSLPTAAVKLHWLSVFEDIRLNIFANID